jgi:transcriptional regulator with XRE-family HTH domain
MTDKEYTGRTMAFDPVQLKKDLIKKRCFDNNMSMDQAAIESGIPKATISRLERLHYPDIDTLVKCCAWLGTKPNRYFKPSNQTP